jgi:predicted metal-dependent phosphoesterase TrpH
MRADLHIHSRHSGDSITGVEKIIQRASFLGLEVIAITDHNSLQGSLEAMDLAENILVLPAMEISSSKGHILAYNMTEEVPRDLSPAETIDRIHDAGGIAVAPHPYRFWSGLGEDAVRRNGFDAIETMNGRCSNSGNSASKDLARELGLPQTAGSDSHDGDSIGSCYMIFPDDCRSPKDLIQAILEGRTEVGGSGRKPIETAGYLLRCVTEWIGRGMKKI